MSRTDRRKKGTPNTRLRADMLALWANDGEVLLGGHPIDRHAVLPGALGALEHLGPRDDLSDPCPAHGRTPRVCRYRRQASRSDRIALCQRVSLGPLMNEYETVTFGPVIRSPFGKVMWLAEPLAPIDGG